VSVRRPRWGLQVAQPTLGPSNFARMPTANLPRGSRLASTHSSVSGTTILLWGVRRAATILAISSREIVGQGELGEVVNVEETGEVIAVSRTRRKARGSTCGLRGDARRGRG